MVDLAKMPHLLVAGATGQGKSVGLNAIITSLLYKKHPSQLKLVLVDPKKVEFNIYSDIEKHFLAKLPDGEDAIITDVTKVVETLNSLCKEMDDRYDLLKKAHVRNIKEYNEKFFNRNLNPEKGHRFLPYIVVIVDEFGDLIMREKIEPVMHVVDLAIEGMKQAGVVPNVKPIRGGTDGARLSFEGLPCPNIFAGGHNFHGRFEYLPVQSMEKAMNSDIKA